MSIRYNYIKIKRKNYTYSITIIKFESILQILFVARPRDYSFQAPYTTNEHSFLATEFSLVGFYHECRKFLCTWGRLAMVVGDRLWATYHEIRIKYIIGR